MATAKFDILSNPIATEAIKPVFASVGATDLAVEKVRDAVADVRKLVLDVQKDLVERVAGVQKDINTVVADVRKADAKKVRAAIEARVAELQGEAKTYPAKVQSLVDDNVANASETYADLVKRGETLVGRIRTQESTQETVKSPRRAPPRRARPPPRRRRPPRRPRPPTPPPRPPRPLPRRPRPPRPRPSSTPPRRLATEENKSS